MSRMPRVMVPAVALAGVAFAAWTAWSAPQPQQVPPPVEPPRAPFPVTVGGAALVEPAGERTSALGAPFAGLVLEVFHVEGDRVAKGDPLFRLDDRTYDAQRVVLEAAAASAKARLERLLALPRAEDIPPIEARVDAARTAVLDRRAALARLERAAGASPGVIPEEDLDRARWSLAGAEKSVATAEADLVRAKQPAWAPDVAEARAALAQAEAAVEENRRNAARAVVRAPYDGTVLEMNVRAGEFATANRETLVLFGDLSSLRVRVDVDEESAPLVRGRPKAVAIVRGFPDRPVELEFVRTEPVVRPKRSLSGATNERVDTRVLQVLFRLGPSELPIYVGQQVDVYMEGASRDDLARRSPPQESVK